MRTIISNSLAEIKLQMQTVDALQAENNRVKEMLSEVLQQDLSPELLENLEYCQTLLLNKDVALALLRHEISEKAHRLKGMNYGSNGNGLSQRSDTKLQRDIEIMKEEIAAMDVCIERIRAARRSVG
jgi:hypothetical protein